MAQSITLRVNDDNKPGDFPPFIAVDTAVFGNLVILVALDADGCVWQYRGTMISQGFDPHGTWLRLGAGRIIPE